MTNPEGRQKRKWPSIRLRAVFFVIIIVVVWLSWYVHRVEQQKESIRWVRQQNGHASYDFETSVDGLFVEESDAPGPKLLANLLGLDFYCRVVDVDILWREVENWERLSKLTGLKYLCLVGSNIKSLSPVSKMSELEILSLDFTEVGDVTPLSELSNLRNLSLAHTHVSDVETLSRLQKLEVLELDHTEIKDLTPLYKLSNLEEIYLSRAQFTNDQIDEFSQNLPNCQVYFVMKSNLKLPPRRK